MNDLQKYKIAKIAWISGLVTLIIALRSEILVHVFDTFEDGNSLFFTLFSLFSIYSGGIQVLHLCGVAIICAFIAIYHCKGGGYLGQRSLPLLPIISITLGLIFMPLSSTIEPMPNSNEMEVHLAWSGYLILMAALVCILVSSMMQKSIDYKELEENANSDNPITKDKRSFVTRILGVEPTWAQKSFFWIMTATLLLWPMIAFVSIFIFDAPIRNSVDEFSRYGIVTTIWFYPLYLYPLMRLLLALSKRWEKSWIYYLIPLIPVGFVVFFGILDSSELAKSKPESYDLHSYERINSDFTKDSEHVYYRNEILKQADPVTFRVLDENYSADAKHVWFNDKIIEGANPNAFVTPKKKEGFSMVANLAHDDHDYYYNFIPLNVEDIVTFNQPDEYWAVDKEMIYYLGKVMHNGTLRQPVYNYQSFVVINSHYAHDAKQVYYDGKIVSGADPATFTLLDKMDSYSDYGKDKNRIYHKGSPTDVTDYNALKHRNTRNGIWDAFHTDGTTVYNPELQAMPSGTDYETLHRFERYRDWYADSARVYYENKLLPGANPKTLKVFQVHYVSEGHVSNNNKSSYYSYDGDVVYYRDSVLRGVDISTFVCGYDYVDSTCFAFDKNRYYEGKPNPRIEKIRNKK